VPVFAKQVIIVEASLDTHPIAQIPSNAIEKHQIKLP